MVNKLGVIVYLVKNEKETLINLKNSIYFLIRFFLSIYKYDVLLFHEDLTSDIINNIMVISKTYNLEKLFSFKKIKMNTPSWINRKQMKNNIKREPVDWWRDEGYRNMCRFYIKEIHNYLDGYDYYMRLDCDSFIESPMKDIFEYCKQKDYDYICHKQELDCHKQELDCHICNNQLLEYTNKYITENNIDNPELPIASVNNNNYINVFFNNFHVSRVNFWKQDNVVKYLDYLDKTGNMYYYRWGDAPIHTLAIYIFSKKFEIVHINYSKRRDRGFDKSGSSSYS